MPNAPNYEQAENDYMTGMKYKDIALKYGVSINTVKSWKKRYEWERKGPPAAGSARSSRGCWLHPLPQVP